MWSSEGLRRRRPCAALCSPWRPLFLSDTNTTRIGCSSDSTNSRVQYRGNSETRPVRFRRHYKVAYQASDNDLEESLHLFCKMWFIKKNSLVKTKTTWCTARHCVVGIHQVSNLVEATSITSTASSKIVIRMNIEISFFFKLKYRSISITFASLW